MEEQLREQVARGVAWSMAEKIGSMLSMTAVRLVILNLLEPRIFGCFAIPSAVAAVAMVVADSGFSQNLIRRRDPGPRDYKAVFVFNMALSSALYVLLALLAPVAARYYGMPEIARICPGLGAGWRIRLTQPPGPDCCSIIPKLGEIERQRVRLQLLPRSFMAPGFSGWVPSSKAKFG